MSSNVKPLKVDVVNEYPNAEQLMQERPLQYARILSLLIEGAKHAQPQLFEFAKEFARWKEDYVERVTVPAYAVLPAWGKHGVEELKLIAATGKWSWVAVSVLLCAARGQSPTKQDVPFLPADWDNTCQYHVGEETSRSAHRALRELMLESSEDVWRQSEILSGISSLVFHTMSQARDEWKSSEEDWENIAETGTPGLESKLDLFFRLLIDPRLNLNERQIAEFQSLLDRDPVKEEELQKFLFDHPIFLDPLAIEVISKHEFGDDFITDFVIRRLNNEYVIVEIEKSTDRLFTATGNTHSDLNEAVRQVREFQTWLADNIAYARTKLPGIARPQGLVVIGRRTQLNQETSRSLEEENFSRRGHIRIVTYDDLVNQARAILNNLLDLPVRIKGKCKVDEEHD